MNQTIVAARVPQAGLVSGNWNATAQGGARSDSQSGTYRGSTGGIASHGQRRSGSRSGFKQAGSRSGLGRRGGLRRKAGPQSEAGDQDARTQKNCRAPERRARCLEAVVERGGGPARAGGSRVGCRCCCFSFVYCPAACGQERGAVRKNRSGSGSGRKGATA